MICFFKKQYKKNSHTFNVRLACLKMLTRITNLFLLDSDLDQ